MAGINIELKKLHDTKGLPGASLSYLYSGVIFAGPIIFLVSVIYGLHFLLVYLGVPDAERESVFIIVSNSGLFSVIVNSIFIMNAIRYVSDLIYDKEYTRILPSFYGVLLVTLVIANIITFIWSFFWELELLHKFIVIGLINAFIIVWTQMSYVNILKNYKMVFVGYIAGFITIFGFMYLFFVILGLDLIFSALASVYIGITLIAFLLMRTILRYLPRGNGSIFHFIRYFNIHPRLLAIGFLWISGSIGHIVVSFFGLYGFVLKGGFLYNSIYDWPAFLSFVTILPTTIYFYTFIESRFYEAYKEYFTLITTDGMYKEVKVARDRMISIAESELFKVSVFQMIFTIVFVIAGGRLLVNMNPAMFGVFRVLCIGYFVFGLANNVFLLSLYFDDQDTCFKASIIFFVSSIVSTVVFHSLGVIFFGIGFTVASALTFVFILIKFRNHMQALNFRTFCSLPLFIKPHSGFFVELSDTLERKMTVDEN